MKVLLVDDNISITKSFEKLLSLKGHECIISNDGRSGLVLCKNEKFDVILLDISMPEFTGIDFIDSLNKDGSINEQKIIILTASSLSEQEIDNLIAKGAYACLKKPISSTVIFKIIDEVNQAIKIS